jgi:hypothetical protein
MKRIEKTLRIAALAACLFATSASALADGLAARESDVPAASRATLVRDIAAYRKAHPEAFKAVADVRGIRPEVYRTFRNPAPNAEPELRALGSAALLPMLDALAFQVPGGTLSTRERTAYTVGLLEAVGLLRDPRSGPVVIAALESGTKDAAVLRAAAVATGRLCGDPELAALTRHTATNDPLRLPAIAGLGECRRIESANHLAALLASATDDASAEPIARALGVVGSSWAWKAAGPAAAAKGLAVREVAARALVGALPHRAGEARTQIAQSVLLLEHPIVPELLRKAATTANAETKVVIERLQKQVEKQR